MPSIWDWSKTPASNGSADSGCPWPEGMARKLVNDSARGMMGRVAEFRDDLGGSLTAGGTANGILVTPNSNVTALADGLVVAFRATADNTGAVTLNYNGLGSKAIRKMGASGDVALNPGDIKSAGIYVLFYSAAMNGGAGAWMLVNPVRPNGPTSQTFLTTNTWNRPVGCKRIVLEGVGAGGGSGGLTGSGAGSAGSTGGGGSGAYGMTPPLDVTTTSSLLITIGAAGLAGIGGGNGGNGGDTFCTVNGVTYTWGGGFGSFSYIANPGPASSAPAVGGSCSNLIGAGKAGAPGFSYPDPTSPFGNARGGQAGESPFGQASLAGARINSAGGAVAGGSGIGCGGSGSAILHATGTVVGIAGGSGCMRVWEYY